MREMFAIVSVDAVFDNNPFAVSCVDFCFRLAFSDDGGRSLLPHLAISLCF